MIFGFSSSNCYQQRWVSNENMSIEAICQPMTFIFFSDVTTGRSPGERYDSPLTCDQSEAKKTLTQLGGFLENSKKWKFQKKINQMNYIYIYIYKFKKEKKKLGFHFWQSATDTILKMLAVKNRKRQARRESFARMIYSYLFAGGLTFWGCNNSPAVNSLKTSELDGCFLDDLWLMITKASLLAGVCFPLGMYWGQSFWCRSDLSHRNVPFKWFNHLILTPPPRGFNSRRVHGAVSCFELLFL